MTDRLVAVDDADYRLPEPVRGALATDAGDVDTELGSALAATYPSKDALGLSLPVGPTLTHAALQEAADAASLAGTRLWAAGTLTTDQTLVIRSDAELGGLTINYTGTGVCVQVGEAASYTRRKVITLPRVYAANKVSAGWAAVAGTTGVKAINLDSCHIIQTHTRNFETGLSMVGLGRGNAYSTVELGHLDNCKVNLLLTADATGWSNQNLYLGGRLSHDSVEGLNVSGVRQVMMTPGLPNPINNNTFTNASFEYGTAEYHLDVAGIANMFINCRYEVSGGARIRWQANATDNQILYGYQARNLLVTRETATSRNHTYHSNGGDRTSGGPMILENTSGSANAYEYAMAAGGSSSGADPTTEFVVKRTANATDMKRSTDAAPRMRLDHQAGRMYVGSGAADPTLYVGAVGSSLGIGGAATTTTAPAAGAAAALPATPAGYITIAIDGTLRKLPYY